ncbi:MAG: hypothetical protein ACXW6V_18470 [Candidatus Binatia bacterium]
METPAILSPQLAAGNISFNAPGVVIVWASTPSGESLAFLPEHRLLRDSKARPLSAESPPNIFKVAFRPVQTIAVQTFPDGVTQHSVQQDFRLRYVPEDFFWIG